MIFLFTCLLLLQTGLAKGEDGRQLKKFVIRRQGRDQQGFPGPAGGQYPTTIAPAYYDQGAAPANGQRGYYDETGGQVMATTPPPYDQGGYEGIDGGQVMATTPAYDATPQETKLKSSGGLNCSCPGEGGAYLPCDCSESGAMALVSTWKRVNKRGRREGRKRRYRNARQRRNRRRRRHRRNRRYRNRLRRYRRRRRYRLPRLYHNELDRYERRRNYFNRRYRRVRNKIRRYNRRRNPYRRRRRYRRRYWEPYHT